jgi:hypothetical protein
VKSLKWSEKFRLLIFFNCNEYKLLLFFQLRKTLLENNRDFFEHSRSHI